MFARSLLNWKANSGEDVKALWAWVRENNIDLDSGEDDWKKVKAFEQMFRDRFLLVCLGYCSPFEPVSYVTPKLPLPETCRGHISSRGRVFSNIIQFHIMFVI